MRFAARTDRNHVEIVDALRAIGCRVRSTAALGDGFSDLIAMRGNGPLRLLEVKDGLLSPSRRKLTPDELKFYHEFFPNVIVVDSVQAAINAMVGA